MGSFFQNYNLSTPQLLLPDCSFVVTWVLPHPRCRFWDQRLSSQQRGLLGLPLLLYTSCNWVGVGAGSGLWIQVGISSQALRFG